MSAYTDDMEELDVGPRAAAIDRWRRRSSVIRFWRGALPALIAALLLLLVGVVVVRSFSEGTGGDEGRTAEIRMVNPRFLGRDDDGRPFVLSAAEAVRDLQDERRVRLVRPVILMDAGGLRPVQVTARNGLYIEGGDILTLRNEVVLYQAPNAEDRGFRFATEEAVVNTRTNDVAGSTPVDGYTPTGRIAGSSYAVYDRGDHIVFRGNVRGRLETR